MPTRLEKCKYGCCRSVNGRSVSIEEYDKETYPATSGRNESEGSIPCRKPCVKCGHSESEHFADGCHHLDDLPPQSHGNPEKLICGCDSFRLSPH